MKKSSTGHLSGKDKKNGHGGQQTRCYHCGEKCGSDTVFTDDLFFCCQGCKTVYDLLKENNLCTYYNLETSPGTSMQDQTQVKAFEYLDDPQVSAKLISFQNDEVAHVRFHVPGIHCSSCIWLLENLHRLDAGIKSCKVDFLAKEAYVIYDTRQVRLSGIAALMQRIGYEPYISLNDLETPQKSNSQRRQVIKIGVAGFCFGNIMMMSFPEYFSLGNFHESEHLRYLFSFLNLALSLPVLLYSAAGFFVSGWKALRYGHLNIDAPIALAIAVTFTRSVYEIVTLSGAGYLDSMTGIVFFMLLGRYFQDRTYKSLSFDRDYKSYFPVGVTVIRSGGEKNIPVSQLVTGDRIRVRNHELIPADAILLSERTHIDYSFLTGESQPVRKTRGDLVYAGARQADGAVMLEIVKPASQSYLTQLWNKDEAAQANERNKKSFTDKVNRYFTIAVLEIAFISALAWVFYDTGKALDALTAVLIVACPCGLLLTTTFTNGNLLRVFGRNGLYLKNGAVSERLASCDTVIFDKTGTITRGSDIRFCGDPLTVEERDLVFSLASQSSHPLSIKIRDFLSMDARQLPLQQFREFPGHGLIGVINGHEVSMGEELFATGHLHSQHQDTTRVYVSVDDEPRGYFAFAAHYREGLSQLVQSLSNDHALAVLSGDNSAEKDRLRQVFGPQAQLLFGQQPADKKEYIRQCQQRGQRVMMIGDGLNDAGALLQSDAGIAVSDNAGHFSPACDAIVNGNALQKLPQFISMARAGKRIIVATFIFSLAYNIAGLFFAVQGMLSPVVAAVLMPASTLTIVLFTTLFTRWAAARRKL